MSGRLHPAIAGLHWRELTVDDADAVYALHVCSVAGMSLAAVKPESEEFLRSILCGRGRVIGAWSRSALIAYGVLQHDLKTADAALVAQMGLQLESFQAMKLAGAAVHPQWRGLGMQRSLIQRRLAWVPANATAFATASPLNLASWHNLMACGLQVCSIQYLYGGYARYVLASASKQLWQGNAARAVTLSMDQLQQQESLLLQGWRGIAPGALRGSLTLLPEQVAMQQVAMQ